MVSSKPASQEFIPSVCPVVPVDLDLGERFTFYARRVRTLALEEILAEEEDSEFGTVQCVVSADVLAVWVAQAYLFPRVTAFVLGAGYLRNSPTHEVIVPGFLRIFNLTTLDLRVEHDQPVLYERFREVLIATCADLRTLLLGGRDYDRNRSLDETRRWAALASDMFSFTTNLHTLIISVPIRHVDLVLISTVCPIRTLEVTHVIDVPNTPALFPAGAFFALTDLTLEDSAPGARLAQNVLAFRPNGLLTRLQLIVRSTTLEVQDMCSVLSETSKHASLRSLEIFASRARDVSYTLEDVTAILASLRPSDCLESLVLDCFACPLDTTHLETVLALYPRLIEWSWPSIPDLRACRLTLQDLLRNLLCRPQIRSLPVTISSSCLCPLEVRASFGTHNYDGFLSISKAADTEAMRALLLSLLPKVSCGCSLVPTLSSIPKLTGLKVRVEEQCLRPRVE
jgi:hypothetical protein